MSFYANNVPVRNGDIVIKATTAAKASQLVNSQGYQDFSTLTTWYEEDPLRNHQKLMSWFGQQNEVSAVPIFQDVIQNDAVLEVNGWGGKFSYDLPVETDTRLKTMDDTSDQEYPGLDGTTFKIVFNREFAPNTTLTCDGMGEDAIRVTDAEPVRDLGYGFEHTVVLMTNNPDASYPSEYLAKDIQYFETGHALAEYDEKFGLVHMPAGTSYMTCEFELGSPQGYESWTTAKANSVNLRFGDTNSQDYIGQLEDFYRKGEEVVLIKNNVPSVGQKYTVASILEMLTIQKFNLNMSTSLMFQRAATFKTAKGYVKYNEGLWHQMQRGFIITYGRRGGITREHIKQARDYVFRANPMKKTIESRLKFKAGTEAYNNVLQIFNDEVQLQLATLGGLLGADRVLPRNPVSGDLYNLRLDPVRFTEVNLPGIGWVEIEEDVTLNYMNITDRNIKGMNPNGYDYTTYSLIIWDATDQQYSNNADLPRGTRRVGGDNREANIYMVAPMQDKIYWGRENGRYSVERATNIIASAKTMTASFFIWGFGAMWMKDPSKFVTIQLEEAARKGFK